MLVEIGGGAPTVCVESIPKESMEEEDALSLRAVLEGALVFLRGRSFVRCSSFGLSSFPRPGVTERIGLGGGAGLLDVYIVRVLANICCRDLKFDPVSWSASSSLAKEGGGLLGGGGGEPSTAMFTRRHRNARAYEAQPTQFSYSLPRD